MANDSNNDRTDKLVKAIVSTYGGSGVNFIDVSNLPVRDEIIEIMEMLIELIFPGYTGKRSITRENVDYIVGDIVCIVRSRLSEQIERALKHRCRLKECPTCDCRNLAVRHTDELLAELPGIRAMLSEDVQAAYDGDPAATSLEETVISYPGIAAIATHRIAHELYLRDVPLIPRIMSENAHMRTGIDIHPGAKISKRFFIDHGTGVVIGETAVIGKNVKLYQGVTLGAMSFAKDDRGHIIKGGKRHPTIEEDVTIYAEATILGDIVIGKGSTVSGNAWVTKSVPAGSIVAPVKSKSRTITPRAI